MDGVIFRRWLKKFDNKMTIQGQKVAMSVEQLPGPSSCSGTEGCEAGLPTPNTISVTHPLYQGIIKNLKVHHCHLLVKRGLLPAVKKKTRFQWTLLDCHSALKDAWVSVKPETVANCFHHYCPVSYASQIPDTDDDEPGDDVDFSALAAILRVSDCSDDNEAVHLFLGLDDDLATAAPFTDEGVNQEVQPSTDGQDEDAEDEDDEEEGRRR